LDAFLDEAGVDIRGVNAIQPALVRGLQNMLADLYDHSEWMHYMSCLFTDFSPTFRRKILSPCTNLSAKNMKQEFIDKVYTLSYNE